MLTGAAVLALEFSRVASFIAALALVLVDLAPVGLASGEWVSRLEGRSVGRSQRLQVKLRAKNLLSAATSTSSAAPASAALATPVVAIVLVFATTLFAIGWRARICLFSSHWRG